MDPNERRMQVFMDIQRGLPRQGPGDDESTLRALRMCTELPPSPDILDVGCGPGMQTIVLAQELDGRITAGDLCQEYLDQLVESAKAAGLRDRIGQMRLDMVDMPFGRDSFDLIWSEGAAYIIGVDEAFKRWEWPLRPRGYLAITELVWLSDDRPREAIEFFAEEYPSMRDVAGNLEIIGESGYEVIDHFTLPDSAWWDHYYTPLEAKLPGLRAKYAGDQDALRLVDAAATEIDIRRRFGDSYGYEFFVARLADPDAPKPTPEDEEGEGAEDVEGGEGVQAAGSVQATDGVQAAEGDSEAPSARTSATSAAAPTSSPNATDVDPEDASDLPSEQKPEYPPPLD